MKHFIVFSILMIAAFSVSANDAPCEVNLFKSQGQINKAIPHTKGSDLDKIINQKNLTLPEVMAKADRFKIVKSIAVERVLIQDEKNIADEPENEPVDVGSKLGGMFQLLIPAKLRNPAR